MTGLIDETRMAFGSLGDAATGLVHPTIRLGVTGLSRAGKTVFITALVHDLLHGARLPLFAPMATGRIARAYLEPQPTIACRALPMRSTWQPSPPAMSAAGRKAPAACRNCA